MTEYGTIKLPREQYETHNEQRQEMGLTWEAYIDGESPEREDMEQLVTELQDAIEVSVDPTIELDETDIQSIQSDVEQLKELVERVPDSTVEKMEGRLR